MDKFINRITDVWDYPKLSIYRNEYNKNFLSYLEESPSNRELRLYIHIPFCNSFCSFCQFYKERYPKKSEFLQRYFRAVFRELEYYAQKLYIRNSIVTSIFMGGGDPSIIPTEIFEELMKRIHNLYNVSDDVSISVEGNVINLLNRERLETYKKYNVSRISFGVQTFDPEIRRKLLLKPTYEQICTLVKLIKAIKIKSFAFDLMYDLPEQTDEILSKDIELAVDLESDYIDFYSLNLYPNTKFYQDIYEKRKFLVKPSKEREYKQNILIQNKMKELRYKQVISCTYSNKYELPHPGLYHFLCNGNMLGIGPSARNYMEGHSHRNYCSINKYMEALENGQLPIETGMILNNEEICRRKLIFEINLLKISGDLIEPLEGASKVVDDLIKLGYIVREGRNYILTESGRPWVGNIQKCFFSEREAKSDLVNFVKSVKEGRSAYNQDFMSVKNTI